MMRKRRCFLIIVVLLSFAFTACKGNSDSQSSSSITDNEDITNGAKIKNETGESSENGQELISTTDGAVKGEENYALFVDVYDSHNARVTIDGLNIQQEYPGEIDGYDLFYDRTFYWGVKFGEYEAAIDYVNGRYADTNFLPFEHEYASLYKQNDQNEILRMPVEINQDYIIINISMPDTIDIDLTKLESYQLQIIEFGEVLCEKEISLAEMENQSGTIATNRIFPKEIYEEGYMTGLGDADYFSPQTEDYILLSMGEDNRNHLLISFDEEGYVKSVMERKKLTSGQHASEFGVVDTKPDDDWMQSNLSSYLGNGYSDASLSGCIEKSAAYVEDCLYVYYDSATAEQEDWAVLSYTQYMNTKEMIIAEGKVAFNSEYQIYYVSQKGLTQEQLTAPSNSELSDFELLQYYTPVTDDYRLTIQKDDNGEYLNISSYDSKGIHVEEVSVYYYNDENSPDIARALGGGFTASKDNSHVVYCSYTNFDTSFTKRDAIIADRSNAQVGDSVTLLYYSVPYLSKEQLN